MHVSSTRPSQPSAEVQQQYNHTSPPVDNSLLYFKSFEQAWQANKDKTRSRTATSIKEGPPRNKKGESMRVVNAASWEIPFGSLGTNTKSQLPMTLARMLRRPTSPISTAKALLNRLVRVSRVIALNSPLASFPRYLTSYTTSFTVWVPSSNSHLLAKDKHIAIPTRGPCAVMVCMTTTNIAMVASRRKGTETMSSGM